MRHCCFFGLCLKPLARAAGENRRNITGAAQQS